MFANPRSSQGKRFKRFLAFLLAAFGWFSTSAVVLAQGALEELRNDARTDLPDPPDRPKPQPARDDNPDDWDEEDSSDGLSGDEFVALTGLIGLGITSPFWGPPVLVGDGYTQSGHFSHYPFENGPAYMLIGPPEAVGLPGARVPYAWSVRGNAEYGADFEDMDWVGGRLLLDTTWRLGIESDFRNVREDITSTWQDSLWIGDVNLLYRFAQSEWVQMRTGLGVNFLSDTEGTDVGFNFTYGGDWFPVKPLVLSAELDVGALGSANLYHLRTTVGANWGICEAYVGYDYYDVGPTQVAGLVSGIRFWY
jgi:hypothetical protein